MYAVILNTYKGYTVFLWNQAHDVVAINHHGVLVMLQEPSADESIIIRHLLDKYAKVRCSSWWGKVRGQFWDHRFCVDLLICTASNITCFGKKMSAKKIDM